MGSLYCLIAGVYLAVVPAGARASDPTVLALTAAALLWLRRRDTSARVVAAWEPMAD